MKVAIYIALGMATLAVPAHAIDLPPETSDSNFIDATSYQSLRQDLDRLVENGSMTQEEATQMMADWLRFKLDEQLRTQEE